MALLKRPESDIWQCEFQVAGKRIRLSTGEADKKKAKVAERALKAAALLASNAPEPSTATLGIVAKRYWTAKVETKREDNLGSTYKADESRYKLLLAHFGEDTLIADIDAAAIAGFKDSILEDGNSVGTFNRHVGMLLAILNFAKDELGLLSVVPKVTKEDADDKRVVSLTDEEEAALLAACKGDLRDLVLFLMDTGARRGEALQLRWREVVMAPEPGHVLFTELTKSGDPRPVPLTARNRAMLTKRQGDAAPSDRVFPYDPVTLTTGTGRKGSKGKVKGGEESAGLRAAWTRARDAAVVALRKARTEAAEGTKKKPDLATSLEGLRLHDLRHHFASRLVRKRVPLYEVGKLLGHSETKITERYAHLDPDALNRAISVLN